MAELGKECFLSKCRQYLAAVIDNINARFEKLHLVSLLGLLDPRNIEVATPVLVMESAEFFEIDGPALWNEFLSYYSLIADLTPTTLEHIVVPNS